MGITNSVFYQRYKADNEGNRIFDIRAGLKLND